MFLRRSSRMSPSGFRQWHDRKPSRESSWVPYSREITGIQNYEILIFSVRLLLAKSFSRHRQKTLPNGNPPHACMLHKQPGSRAWKWNDVRLPPKTNRFSWIMSKYLAITAQENGHRASADAVRMMNPDGIAYRNYRLLLNKAHRLASM